MMTWSVMGSTTSCRAPCFQYAMAPLEGSEAMRSGTVLRTRAISTSAGRRSATGESLWRALGATSRASKGSCRIGLFIELSSRSEGTSLTAERLMLTHASPPIARRFPGQSPERCGEGRLRGIAKLHRHRHDRCVSVAQHIHGLLEPVLPQPS